MLKLKSDLAFYFNTNCEIIPDTISYNSIGEITGSEFPTEFILFGGYEDSWDNSPGIHDDIVGYMQSIEVSML